MKKNRILLVASYALGVLTMSTLTGCGDKFPDEYPWLVGGKEESSSEDEDGLGAKDISVLEKELKGAIPLMLNYASKGHEYQYERANSIDNYAGYWTVSQNNFTFGGALPTLYTYPNAYLGGPMSNGVFNSSKNAIFHAVKLGKPEWRAVALIIQGYIAHETVDFYGSIPFEDWRNKKRTRPLTYEKGEDVYNKVFADLDEAIKILKERQPSSGELALIEDPKETLAKGDWTRWVKFANSIKLRMAMNIVKVNPSDAQKYAEEAVNDNIGVFTSRDAMDFGYYFQETNALHPLFQLSVNWDDLRMGASIENILKIYDNPLIEKWFTKNTNPINTAQGAFSGVGANQDYIGIRQGVAMINKSSKQRGYGPFSVATQFMGEMPKTYFKRTEATFLRAEGALRGWNMGGTAQSLYEEGIRLAFSENGIEGAAVDNYLNIVTPKVVNYSDPYNPSNSIKGRVKVGVKWNDQDTKEVMLEKIITQKYIAIFPLSSEAWTTFRRTGYPRLFPVKLNNMDDVDSELQLRRIPLVEDVLNSNEINNSMVPALGGPNTGGTRVFWDIKTEKRGEIIEAGSEWKEVIPVNF